MLPSWEPKEVISLLFYPLEKVSAWGPALGPYLSLWLFLVSWSIPPMSPARAQPSGESERQLEREPGIPSGGAPPRLARGSSAPTWPSHQSRGSGGQRG